MKPALFIPLKTEHYEAFERGDKTEEYRPFGPRWNRATCKVGRRVTLSKGYGKRHRLHGVIVSFRVSEEPTRTPAWIGCYGDRQCEAACIGIRVERA